MQVRHSALWAMFSLLAALTAACSGTGSDRQSEEAAIRRADAASLQAIAAKQLDATLSFYDDGASLFIPNAPLATGREEIRKSWQQMFAVPGFTLAPEITKIEVARSGELAYVQGVYKASFSDPNGAPVADRGKFVVVWKKQSDGAWKIAADIWNSDLPPTAAAK